MAAVTIVAGFAEKLAERWTACGYREPVYDLRGIFGREPKSNELLDEPQSIQRHRDQVFNLFCFPGLEPE
jgi:hypothetical protein